MEKKEGRFSWRHRDIDQGSPEMNLQDVMNDSKGEDDYMAFANGSLTGESKKTGAEAAAQAEPPKPSVPVISPKNQESYISQDVVINGSISAVNSIVIDGTVNGNVTTDNDLTICGTVEGDITAGCVKFSGARIKGDIKCSDNLSLAKETVVNGNVSAKNVEVNGTLTGNLTAEETAVIMGSAVVNGDITAGLISVLEGAVIKGNVQINRKAAAASQPALKPVSQPASEVPKQKPAAENDPTLLKRYL